MGLAMILIFFGALGIRTLIITHPFKKPYDSFASFCVTLILSIVFLNITTAIIMFEFCKIGR